MYWNRNDFDFPIASSRQKKNSLWLFFWSGRRSLADAWVRCSTCALVWFSSSHYPHALKTRHWRLFFTGFRFPSPYKKRTALGCSFGAGEGNRTLVFSLGSWCFATKLRSHLPFGSSDRRQCLYFRGAEKWSWKRDLNTRPVHYECTALPTELFQHRLYREISHAGLPIYYTTNSWFVKRFQKNSLKNQKNDWNRRKDVL